MYDMQNLDFRMAKEELVEEQMEYCMLSSG